MIFCEIDDDGRESVGSGSGGGGGDIDGGSIAYVCVIVFVEFMQMGM